MHSNLEFEATTVYQNLLLEWKINIWLNMQYIRVTIDHYEWEKTANLQCLCQTDQSNWALWQNPKRQRRKTHAKKKPNQETLVSQYIVELS